jgi:hypothetical protein
MSAYPPHHLVHEANDVRHRAAVRRTVSWADEAASHQDFAGALQWLAVIEAIGDHLSPALLEKRTDWARSGARAAGPSGD